MPNNEESAVSADRGKQTPRLTTRDVVLIVETIVGFFAMLVMIGMGFLFALEADSQIAIILFWTVAGVLCPAAPWIATALTKEDQTPLMAIFGAAPSVLALLLVAVAFTS